VNLVWAHARTATVELLRYPTFSVPTLLFPTVLFLAWGSRTGAPPELAMVSYAAFAVVGVAFFQFGVGIAAERASPWHLFLRVLPAPPWVHFGARLLSALAFALASSAVVVGVALAVTDPHLPGKRWVALAAVLLLGSVPFALLGIAIGYWLTPRGALPAANLLFLGLTFAGGLLGGAENLPGAVAAVAETLPTRLWGELLAAAVGLGPWRLENVVALAGYTVGFAGLAAWGYRRDEGERFR
jgi:ABC-2 type transport system permease protein